MKGNNTLTRAAAECQCDDDFRILPQSDGNSTLGSFNQRQISKATLHKKDTEFARLLF